MDHSLNLHMKSLCSQNFNKYDSKITNNQFLLGRFFKPKKHQCSKPFKKTKTAKLLKNQLQFVNEENINKFQLYLPLHKLWLSYISSLLQQEHNQESRALKLLRSDFHGAFIEVISSKTETYVGIQGIVVTETLRTFKVVCPQKNTIKTILKSVCVFVVKVEQKNAYIVNGESLVYRPSDRIKHKFKFKKMQKVNYEFLSMLKEVEEEGKPE